MKILTKSRFRLGLECPNKLFYTRKNEYANQKQEDTFLKALAQGGFQVEELARLHYPDGILIEGNDWDYKLLWKQTQDLLQNENVVIFEAAFLIDQLFVRTDILVKKGNQIKLIEVKSKSYDPNNPNFFVGKRGGLVSGWKPYCFDLAFQSFVIKNCFPNWNIHNYFMLADKTKKATIDGLNQLFRVTEGANNRTGIVKLVDSMEEIGESVLSEVGVDDIITNIHSDKFKYYENLGFKEAVTNFSNWYLSDTYPNWPLSFGVCKNCEFKTTAEDAAIKKSGYVACYQKQKGLVASDFKEPTILEIWNFRKRSLFDAGKFFMKDLDENDLEIKPLANKLSQSERQWLQVEKAVQNDMSSYIDKEGIKKEISSWVFPLHFIDFETSTVALPFTKGMAPYEQVAFQFSHHMVYESGKIEHKDEYLNCEAGVFPNFEFIRALKNSLMNDNGTIFRYSHHENTILNAIYVQLCNSNETDKEDLKDFIKIISHSRKESVEKWKGQRDMVDLCQLVIDYYYNPLTKGSNSIKAVLPAILESSNYLKKKYSLPISELNLTSIHFKKSHIWLEINNGIVQNPYKMLKPLFEEWTDEQLDTIISEMDSIADGGAALTAYAKLQYSDMNVLERTSLMQGLLKYCELDTLAMVMIYEHFVNDLL